MNDEPLKPFKWLQVNLKSCLFFSSIFEYFNILSLVLVFYMLLRV